MPQVAKYWFHKKHAFRDYTTHGKGTGIYLIDDRVKIGIAGDWGTGTDEAKIVAAAMEKSEADFTVHLGDVYYVGDSNEVRETFLGEKTSPYAPADHVPGTQTTLPIADTGTSDGLDPSQPRYSVYSVPRSLLLENHNLQCLLCDPYLLAVATRYLGVFPVITKPDMWWDTDFLPQGLRPRPFHVDSGCLRWIKVGVNLTDTTFESPHFVYVKGSHIPNKTTRPLTRRLVRRMNLSDKEVNDVCPEKIVHVTGPAGSIVLADTRGIHKGELSLQGHRLVLYFGLEGSAFNNIDRPVLLNKVGSELGKAMSKRPFSYQFFRAAH